MCIYTDIYVTEIIEYYKTGKWPKKGNQVSLEESVENKSSNEKPEEKL
jgi:hypothetical protein